MRYLGGELLSIRTDNGDISDAAASWSVLVHSLYSGVFSAIAVFCNCILIRGGECDGTVICFQN